MTSDETAREVTLVIPIPDRNTGGNARGHWSTIRTARIESQWYGFMAVLRAGYRDLNWTPVEITIDWFGYGFHRGSLPDRDNIISRCKPVVDGIVAAGLIPDDSPEHVAAITVRMVTLDPDDPRVEIEVRRLDGGGERGNE